MAYQRGDAYRMAPPAIRKFSMIDEIEIDASQEQRSGITISVVSHGHGQMIVPLIRILLDFPEVGKDYCHTQYTGGHFASGKPDHFEDI